MPERVAKLPRTKVGYPVPWFVAWVDGEAEFRVMDGEKLARAVRSHLCWICGDPLGGTFAFVVGPMCAINRLSSEPPSHVDCATYAARACPFLSHPQMVRREHGLPEAAVTAPGISIRRNPGVALVWTTKGYDLEREPGDPSPLFRMRPAIATAWYAEGREATRAEILESIDSGFPILQEVADAEGALARRALAEQHAAALELVPA